MHSAAWPAVLFEGRLASKFLQQPPRDVPHAAHRLDHVHGNANRSALIGDRAGDRLANPPGCVGAKLNPRRFRTSRPPASNRCSLPGSDREAEAAIAILLGDRNDQTQVRLRRGLAWRVDTCGKSFSIPRRAGETWWRFFDRPQDVAILNDHRLAFRGWPALFFHLLNLRLQFHDAIAKPSSGRMNASMPRVCEGPIPRPAARPADAAAQAVAKRRGASAVRRLLLVAIR